MADAHAMLAQPPHVIVGEMNSVGEPGPVIEPAHILKVVERAHPEHRLAEFILVMRFGEVGVQTAVVLLGQRSAGAHQRLGHAEGRARRERDLDHRARTALVILADHALAVGEDRILILDDGVRWKAAVLHRQVHRPARDGHPHAEPARFLHLDVHRIVEMGGKQIVMVGCGGDAGHQQFGQRQPRRQPHRVGREPRPDGIERLEPVEELLVDGLGMRAGQRLVEMMMRIDQSRQHHMLRRIKHLINRFGRFLAAAEQFGDAAVAEHNSPGCVRQNCQWRCDPDTSHNVT